MKFLATRVRMSMIMFLENMALHEITCPEDTR